MIVNQHFEQGENEDKVSIMEKGVEFVLTPLSARKKFQDFAFSSFRVLKRPWGLIWFYIDM